MELLMRREHTDTWLIPEITFLICGLVFTCTPPTLYIGHEALHSGDEFGPGNKTDFILLSEVNCTGNEERLINCSYVEPVLCFRGEEAAVICNTRPDIGNWYCNNLVQQHYLHLCTIVSSQPMFPTATPEGPKGSPSLAQGAKIALAVCLPLLVVVVILLAVSVVVVRYATMKRYV